MGAAVIPVLCWLGRSSRFLFVASLQLHVPPLDAVCVVEMAERALDLLSYANSLKQDFFYFTERIPWTRYHNGRC